MTLALEILLALVAIGSVISCYVVSNHHLEDIKDSLPSRTMTIYPNGRVTWSKWEMPTKNCF